MVYIVDILSSALATILSFLTAGLYTPGPAALTPTEYASMKRKSIVIVGGSYAGVGTAHRVLKQAARAPRAGPFKVTLVSRDTHMYWNIAAPRALIPGQLADDEIFRSVTEGFAQYPAEEFEFVLGSATGVDTDGKTLQVEKADGTALELGYDYLVVATGARSMLGSPFKSLGSTESTKEGLRALQERIKKAKTIVVGGAGPTGTEVAGELADEYGKDKTVTLVTAGSVVLPGRPKSVSNTAEKQLRNLGIDLKLNTKATDQTELPDGRTELTLTGPSGEPTKLVVDLYIPTSGVIPNSSFLPPKMLNPAGFVKVGHKLDVPGAEGVFAIGEVSAVEPAQYVHLERQAGHMAKSLLQLLSGNGPLPYKASTKLMGGFQFGRKAGTGHFGNIKLPTFLVVSIRKTQFLERFPGMLDGSAF